MVAAKYTQVLRCPHCSNQGLMEVLSEAADHLISYDDDREDWESEGVNLYHLLICQVCRKPLLKQRWQHDMKGNGPGAWSFLYPEIKSLSKELPLRIAKALDEAERVRGISANAYGILATRALEFICKHKKCKGQNLKEMIDSLAENKEIPERLANMAQQLRIIRNHGAHGNFVDLSVKEVPVVKAILNALVEYIYYAPKILEEAQQLVTKLNSTKKHSG